MKILIPTSITLDQSQLGLEEGDSTVLYNPRQALDPRDYDADVLVAWANSKRQLEDAAAHLERVELVQALLAGPDQVAATGFRDEAVVTSGIGLHSQTVAEHALALTLNLVRFLPTLAKHQEDHHWASELGGAQELYPKDQVTTLLKARVTIWGFGSIGRATARLFQAFGARVTGVARSTGERDGFPVVATEDIDRLLPETDILVMILPQAESTHRALNADLLAKLPKQAYVVNVGRGSTVNEDDLVSALNTGQIAGAAIDVAATEPLPEDSALWEAQNLVITPHAAGGRPVNPEALIKQNLQALRDTRAGRPAHWRNRMN